jgi:hypothetical protein
MKRSNHKDKYCAHCKTKVKAGGLGIRAVEVVPNQYEIVLFPPFLPSSLDQEIKDEARPSLS